MHGPEPGTYKRYVALLRFCQRCFRPLAGEASFQRRDGPICEIKNFSTAPPGIAGWSLDVTAPSPESAVDRDIRASKVRLHPRRNSSV